MATPDHRYCNRLLFASAQERDKLGRVLDEHIELAGALIGRRLDPGCLFVSGSLARGEPSVGTTHDGNLRLDSDVDFVYCGLAEPETVVAAERELQTLFPAFQDTLYALRPPQVSQLRSASARDLSLGMRWPVFSALHVDPPSGFVLGPDDGLEVLIYAVAAYLSESVRGDGVQQAPLPGVARRTKAQLLIKLAAEALRSLARGREKFSEALTYWAVYQERREPHFQRIAEESDVVTILRCRECGTALPPHVRQMLWAMIGRVLSDLTPGEPRRIPDLVASLRGTCFSEPTLLHRYPLLVVGTALRAGIGQEDSSDAWFLDLWCDELIRADAGPDGETPIQAVARLRYPYVLALMAAKDSGRGLTAHRATRSIARNESRASGPRPC